MCHNVLQDQTIFQILLRIDADLAARTQAGRCACGGALHRADYPRKPRGCLKAARAAYSSRFSFCCSCCRKRRTAPSVRFLGRRVYLALVVVLMASRLTARTPGTQTLCALIAVPRRTLQRWRSWWVQDFPLTRLWQAEVACILPSVSREDLPQSLLVRFAGPPLEALLHGLLLLTPLTTRT
ncbi:hypothetical protein HMI48_10825 [Acidithiobacillus ferrooxidans]|uniref:hypothetical protein n=1 Tax=Acidithiobacillus ferrooxidans TaxID=920 RepID=UPI001C075278|nr:hypothetical protein [Acidithiobacillus ferrooxidans]MBU2774344.1 hypothetical protein [Acidithiobacillus ferrooxidans]